MDVRFNKVRGPFAAIHWDIRGNFRKHSTGKIICIFCDLAF
jgi:hypothetical protein